VLEPTVPRPPAGPITGESLVGDVLDQYPWLVETLVSAGFGLLRNRLLRGTLARWTTIAQACQQMGVDKPNLLESLNSQRLHPPVAGSTRAVSHPLPILPTIQRKQSEEV